MQGEPEQGLAHRGRFLILTVKARPPKTRKEGGQGIFYTDNGFLTDYFCE